MYAIRSYYVFAFGGFVDELALPATGEVARFEVDHCLNLSFTGIIKDEVFGEQVIMAGRKIWLISLHRPFNRVRNLAHPVEIVGKERS